MNFKKEAASKEELRTILALLDHEQLVVQLKSALWQIYLIMDLLTSDDYSDVPMPAEEFLRFVRVSMGSTNYDEFVAVLKGKKDDDSL